jgi:hypothetical protein
MFTGPQRRASSILLVALVLASCGHSKPKRMRFAEDAFAIPAIGTTTADAITNLAVALTTTGDACVAWVVNRNYASGSGHTVRELWYYVHPNGGRTGGVPVRLFSGPLGDIAVATQEESTAVFVHTSGAIMRLRSALGSQHWEFDTLVVAQRGSAFQSMEARQYPDGTPLLLACETQLVSPGSIRTRRPGRVIALVPRRRLERTTIIEWSDAIGRQPRPAIAPAGGDLTFAVSLASLSDVRLWTGTIRQSSKGLSHTVTGMTKLGAAGQKPSILNLLILPHARDPIVLVEAEQLYLLDKQTGILRLAEWGGRRSRIPIPRGRHFAFGFIGEGRGLLAWLDLSGHSDLYSRLGPIATLLGAKQSKVSDVMVSEWGDESTLQSIASSGRRVQQLPTVVSQVAVAARSTGCVIVWAGRRSHDNTREGSDPEQVWIARGSAHES